jgi:hypothetical protein
VKVFLSWSGKVSRDIAVALDDWLPYVIQSVKPFVSTGDIDKGRRWSEVLASELASIGYGIIVITRDNLREPWINFEAGAISKAIDKSSVSPFLFGVDPSKLEGPLQQFQATIYEQEDVFNLIRSINARLDEEHQVAFEVLRNEFDAWWPKLKKRLDEILASQQLENETGYDWLYSTRDLARYMSKPQQVWVIAPHLYRNALVSPMRDVINQNLKAGAIYTFLISQGDDGAELHRMAAASPGLIHVVPLEEHEFQSNAVTDYVIQDPDSESVAVFLELPIQARGYWIEVDREAAIGLVERFRRFVNRILADSKPVDLGKPG